MMTSLPTATLLIMIIVFITTMKGKTSEITPCSLGINQCTCTSSVYQCSPAKEPLQEVPIDIPSTVTQIDLSGNFISMVTNSSFPRLNSLRYLNLNRNRLRWIQSSAFNDLLSLQTLDLSDNILEELDARHFYPFISLQKLNITQNPNLNISINAFQNAPTLTEIMADRNFNGGHYDFSDLEQLETIHLGGCKVRLFYADNFRNLPGLTRLQLSGNELVDFPVSILEQLTNLEDLKLSGNFIRDLRGYSFSSNPNLTVLDLSQNEIVSLDGAHLNSLKALRRLDLTGNKIKVFPQNQLPNPPSHRLQLQLRGNPLVCDCTLKWLVKFLKAKPSIQFFGRCQEPEDMVGLDPGRSEEFHFLCPPRQRPLGSLSHVVSVSNPVVLTCPVTGDPFPSITWYYHSQTTALNTPVDSRYVRHSVEGPKVSYEVVTFDQAGLYICNASNKIGYKEVHMALTVVPLPGTLSNTSCSCKKPIVLVLVLFITIICGLSAILFLYRKYLTAVRAHRNLAYATLRENEGEAI